MGDRLRAVPGVLRRDPFTAFLLFASIGLALAFCAALLGSTRPESEGAPTAISEVRRLADAKRIARATLLDYDNRVVVHLRDGRTLWATYPSADGESGQLVILERAGAVTDVNPQTSKELRQIVVQFLIPILLLVCLFALFTRIGQGVDGASGLASFSRWRGTGRSDLRPLSFADVAGATEAVVELREIRDFLADPSRYAALGARAPKGVLLVGSPGTGKTLLARAVAGEADVPLLVDVGLCSSWSRSSAWARRRVRDLFAPGPQEAPAIVFIDELDAAGRQAGRGLGHGNDEREQTLNQLLVEMDGFVGGAGIVVLGATNRPDILDPALLRPGRFDRRVMVDRAGHHGRVRIIEAPSRRGPSAGGRDLAEVAQLCPGFTGADLANWSPTRPLAGGAGGSGGDPDAADLEEGVDRVIAGPERRSHALTARGSGGRSRIHEASGTRSWRARSGRRAPRRSCRSSPAGATWGPLRPSWSIATGWCSASRTCFASSPR